MAGPTVWPAPALKRDFCRFESGLAKKIEKTVVITAKIHYVPTSCVRRNGARQTAPTIKPTKLEENGENWAMDVGEGGG